MEGGGAYGKWAWRLTEADTGGEGEGDEAGDDWIERDADDIAAVVVGVDVDAGTRTLVLMGFGLGFGCGGCNCWALLEESTPFWDGTRTTADDCGCDVDLAVVVVLVAGVTVDFLTGVEVVADVEVVVVGFVDAEAAVVEAEAEEVDDDGSDKLRQTLQRNKQKSHHRINVRKAVFRYSLFLLNTFLSYPVLHPIHLVDKTIDQ